ncbi:hypothetical protein RB608_15465 [Nocardioides sp. LHD-245]|uniref:hypothetical protein n=1 Tax=Nocardioides sp. LHD-245 TaxID=3051387 RepID=UPI0027E082D2|nr:hypothetical protein [Nocardioides sp. LHD-245]
MARTGSLVAVPAGRVPGRDRVWMWRAHARALLGPPGRGVPGPDVLASTALHFNEVKCDLKEVRVAASQPGG